MSERLRLTEVPTPLWRIGDTVFGIGTRDGEETVPCPDCRESRIWKVIAPSGFETTVECPRCNGKGRLGIRSRVPYVQQLTVGSIRTTTTPSDYDEAVVYMAEETGIGSGTLWAESRLRATKEEAEEASELQAALERVDLDRGPGGEERREVRYLNKYTMMTAEAKAANRRAWSVGYDFDRLMERIAQLEPDTFLSSYGFDDEGEGGYATLALDERTVRVLQEHLCSFGVGQRGVEGLRRARSDVAESKECKC